MSAMKIELPIDEKARNYAKIYSSMIRDEYQRKRANAAIMALNGYVNHLNKSHAVKIQNSMTLYRNPSLCEQYELADFYVNNYHIDVRVTIDKDTVLLPKIHYDNNIIPDFYVVVKTDRNLNSFELLGIIDTSQTKPQPSDFHYYMANSDSFISNEEFIDRVKNQKPERRDGKEHENFANNYLAFIDNEMNSQRKIQILKHLFNCVDCRTEFCCFSGFEMVNCNAANYPELFDDKTLDIVGAQIDENSEEYKAKEETIYIGGDEESSQSNQEESIQEEENKESELTLISDDESTDKDNESEENEDILDELFGDEEAETSNSADDIEMIEEEQPKNNEMDVIEPDNSAVNEQKVIIDYDATGAPIYSYISNTESENTSSEIENIEDEEESSDLQLDIDDKNVNQELSTIYDEEEYPQNIIETIDEEKENTDTEEAEETKEKENENTESNENSDEIDIMDQMFVDGALEREAREQQDVSYNPLSTPVDSHIPDEVIETPQDIEPSEEPSLEEQSNDEQIEEINAESEEEQLVDESQETEILAEDEETETVNENEEEETLVEEEEETPIQDDEIETEDNQDEIVENIVEEEVENPVDNSFIEENQEPEPQAVHMFDNYISSEMTNKEEEQEEETREQEEDYTHESVENIDDAITYSSENEDNDENEEYDKNEEDSEDDYYSEGENVMDFENNSNESSMKKLIITIAVIAVILMAFGAGIFFYLKNKEAAEIPSEPLPAAQEEVMEPNNDENLELPTIEPNGEIQPSEQNELQGSSETETVSLETPEINTGIPELNKPENSIKQLTEEDLTKKQDDYKDINKAITKALSGGENLVTVKGLSWFCPAELFSDKAFKAYMQSLDNILKQNLKNNILGVTELPQKNQVTVKFAVDNNRNLRKSVITESSGSEEIDKIVLRSINETFMGEKSPILSDSPLKADMYYFKVVIKF